MVDLPAGPVSGAECDGRQKPESILCQAGEFAAAIRGRLSIPGISGICRVVEQGLSGMVLDATRVQRHWTVPRTGCVAGLVLPVAHQRRDGMRRLRDDGLSRRLCNNSPDKSPAIVFH